MNEQLDHLISLFLLDSAAMSPQQADQLSEWIKQNPDNARTFILSALLHRNIHDTFLRADNARNVLLQCDPAASDAESLLNPEVWQMLSKAEMTAPTVADKQPEIPRPMLLDAQPARTFPRKINKYSLMTAIASLAALFFLIVFAHYTPLPQNQEVATLSDTIHAQWAESDAFFKPGLRLTAKSKSMMLRNGIAKLDFDNNTRVVIEAPSEFEIMDSDHIKIKYGRVYATVPPEAIGFTITTPNSKIIDLGTEFGVQTDPHGCTELHVIKGKTTLVAGGNNQKTSLQISQGFAKTISRSSQIADIPCSDTLFVRDIQSQNNVVWRGQPLDLADMVGGGNGLGTGKSNIGLRWDNGEFASTEDYYVGQRQNSTNLFIAAPDSLFINGIFSPDGSSGPVAISQDGGHLWQPPKTCGQYCYNINNSGLVSRGTGRIPGHLQSLGGQACGGTDYPAICIHPNAGITFDLEKIRALHSTLSLKSFTAQCGLSETVVHYAQQALPGYLPKASFYVLIDGQEKFAKENLTPAHGAVSIDIPIEPKDRFLTLVTTGGTEQKVSYDWCLFARPQLNPE
ncbi:MAG: NPCBM/NEW2 domain-containing protein [Sedimentisphaerales bacterium]|nr:NPCBM/NEW2 domain-containing protein [Sedimentisphaerales bacterium]